MEKKINVKEIIVHPSWNRAKKGNVGFNVQKHHFIIFRKQHSTPRTY